MNQPVVAAACRTPIGLRHGGLSGWHPADLAGAVLAALARCSGLDPADVDEVVLGCATLVGDQGCNLARSAVLAAGWPESVPATTVDRQGAASLQAVAVAAQAVASGHAEVVVAAGVELSTTTPAGSWVEPGTRPFGPGVVRRYAERGGLIPPGVAAERLAERAGLDRPALDAWADRSRRRARRAGAAGAFTAELVAVPARRWDRERRVVWDPGTEVEADEGPGHDPGDAATCPPLFVPGGAVTAANQAPVADGAAAVLVMAPERVAATGPGRPLARVVATAGAAVDPRETFSAAAPATTRLLDRAGVGPGEVERFEVDETFACVPLAWMAELGIDGERVNPAGGAIALGHPPGASGARMVTTLCHGLAGTGALGLAVLGGVGGVATAVLVVGSG